MAAQRLTATQAAIISMNVPHHRRINESIFDGLLCGTVSVDEWEAHLEILFADVPASILAEILVEKKIGLDRLADMYFKLPMVYQSKSFKEFLKAKLGSTA